MADCPGRLYHDILYVRCRSVIWGLPRLLYPHRSQWALTFRDQLDRLRSSLSPVCCRPSCRKTVRAGLFPPLSNCRFCALHFLNLHAIARPAPPLLPIFSCAEHRYGNRNGADVYPQHIHFRTLLSQKEIFGYGSCNHWG